MTARPITIQLVSILIAGCLTLSSCAPTRAIETKPWDPSAVAGPIRLIILMDPSRMEDLHQIAQFTDNQSFRLYARIADSAGTIFGLPSGVSARWTVMGAGGTSRIHLHPGSATGWAHGNMVDVRLLRPTQESSYGIQVVVPLSSDISLEKFLPVVPSSGLLR